MTKATSFQKRTEFGAVFIPKALRLLLKALSPEAYPRTLKHPAVNPKPTWRFRGSYK